MTDTNDIVLLLGRLEGKFDSFSLSQAHQDTRIDRIEEKLNALITKVAIIGGLVGGGAGYAAGIFH